MRWTHLAAWLLISLCPGARGQDPPATKPAEPEFIDVFKVHKADYARHAEPTILDIGPATYLTLEGKGAPEMDGFQQAMPAMFGVAFALKNDCARNHGFNFGVGIVEAQWWADELYESFLDAPRDEWQWRILVRVPEKVMEEMAAAAIAARAPKDDKDSPVHRIKLEVIEEGPCIQMLHKGPYADEPANIEKMHRALAEQGYEATGRHHEIYLNAPQMVRPEDLLTILRQPVKESGDE